MRTEEKHIEAMLKQVEHRRDAVGTDEGSAFRTHITDTLTRGRAFAAKLKEAHALLEAERIEAFSTADEPQSAFQNPLGDGDGDGEDNEGADEDSNGLSKT